MAENKICLNLIVKNEAHVIQRCFDSISHLIDRYVILDTGSEDNTIKIINDYMQRKGIPGQVYTDTWCDDFGYSRTKALDLARRDIQQSVQGPLTEAEWKKKPEWYVMFMDADNQVFADNGKDRISIDKSKLTADDYNIDMRQSNSVFNYLWLVKIPELGRDHRTRRWEGVLHEFLCPDGWTTTQSKIKGGYVLTGREGDRNKNPNKYIKDIYILNCAVQQHPNNDRYWYYLARSYGDAGNRQEAIRCYKKRISLKGWNEEVYTSYLAIANYNKGDDNKYVKYLTKAINTIPNRLEAPFRLIEYYRLKDLFTMGWIIAQGVLSYPQPSGHTLFIEHEVQNWKFYDTASICAFYAGNKQESAQLCRKILMMGKLPDHEIARVKKNLEFSEK